MKHKLLYQYIEKIKQSNKVDIYSVINTTLISNPFVTHFPKNFLLKYGKKENKLKLFIIHTGKFYATNVIYFLSYFQVFVCYKLWYKKPKYTTSKNDLVLDIFVDINRICKENHFCEPYFSSLYPVLSEREKDCVFLPRFHSLSLNPIKTHKQFKNFFQIINKDENNFLFEFEFLSFGDFLRLSWMFICYPLKTLNLIEKEKTTQDVIFNVHLLKDISKVGFDAFTRYIFGRNISSIKNIDKIYSWSEFQVVERAFNYGIRKYSNIIINACQFYINYPIYFNSFVQDIDELGGYAPHKVLVNGRYYLRKCENIKYELGVSFRYAKIFEYKKQNTGNNIVVLGSYLIDETKNTLELVKIFDNIIFKSHPTVDNSNFKDQIERNTQVTNEDIYDLFPKALIIVGNASGSLVEAVACGVSVIVLARENELIPNPLVDFGKGEIWDIAFNKKELIDRCQQLLIYRKNNPDKINVIAAWYKDNFFIEPTKENISKVFF